MQCIFNSGIMEMEMGREIARIKLSFERKEIKVQMLNKMRGD